MRKNVYLEYPPLAVLKDYYFLKQDSIFLLENYLSFYFSNPNYENKIKKNFVPSKTAQNGLNFISKEDELVLGNSDLSSSEEIISTFKIIYILVNQNYKNYDENLLASNLINNIMVKFGVSNLSKINILILEILFLNIICYNLILTKDQFILIKEVVDSNQNFLNPSAMLKKNKIVSYITFIVKEIYDYIHFKTEDGTMIQNLKKRYYELNQMKKRLEKINTVLKINK